MSTFLLYNVMCTCSVKMRHLELEVFEVIYFF